MKPFNIEEYLKNPSRKVVTRGGSRVKIHCTNFLGVNPVIAEIEGSGQSRSFGIDGRYFSNDESVRDLFFAPEKHEGWGVICGTVLAGEIFSSKEEAEIFAKQAQSKEFVAVAKIEWEE